MSAQITKTRVAPQIAVAIVVLIVGGVLLFNHYRATAVVVTVTRGLAVDAVSGSVVVHADKDLQEIKSDSGGRVTWIDPRQLGEPFKAGEPILKLDSSDLEREIKQAEDDYNASVERLKIQKQKDATLELAKDNLAIAQRRHDRGEISEDDFKAAQRALDRVQTELALADFDAKQGKLGFDNAQAARKRALEKMTVRAPADGILQSILVAPGALIGPGTTVATFFSNQRNVIAKVSEEDVGKVKVGQPAKVHLLNLGDETLDAKVSTILPFADADTQRYSVYLDVAAEPKKLKPFATGEVSITVGEHPNQPRIPRRAVFNDDYVFVVKGGVVEKRKVKLGFRALNFAEVVENLAPGEQVIVDDLDQFRDGQHVKVVEAKAGI